MIVSSVQCNLCSKQMDIYAGSNWREKFVGVMIDSEDKPSGITLISSGDISEMKLHLCLECIQSIRKR